MSKLTGEPRFSVIWFSINYYTHSNSPRDIYKNNILFTIYNSFHVLAICHTLPHAIAHGGRYDDVGRAFGRARPATGFSIELRALAGLRENAEPASAIRAPWSDDVALVEAIDALRAAGEIVVQALPGRDPGPQEFICDRELVLRGNEWVVGPIGAVR